MSLPFKSATRTGGEFLDLRELCADEPVLALFRIVTFLPPVPDNFKRMTYPVVADVLICSGPREGEVHLAEEFKFAPANVLRGVSAKASESGAQPTNAPGELIASIVRMVEKKGSQPFVGLDPVDADASEQIGKVFDNGNGWDGAAPSAPSAPAAAAVPDAGARPWKKG